MLLEGATVVTSADMVSPLLEVFPAVIYSSEREESSMTPAVRLIWVCMYERTGNAGRMCRRCGVLHPTLRK